MDQPEIKSESDMSANKTKIPNAFSKCANCNISYKDSSTTNVAESVLLVCLHSFCRNCINNGCLRSDKGDPNLVTCCKCKCNSNRADCGINLLADAEFRLDGQNTNLIKCSSCNDQTIATCKCTTCHDMLCDACVSAHKRVKLTRDHPIVPLVSQNGATQSSKVNKRYSCPKHSAEKLQYYCDLCNKVTCTGCHEATADHFNHPKTEVTQASIAFRQNLKVQLHNLDEKEKTVGQALAIVNEKMEDVDEAEKKALTEVREYYNTCMEALRTRMNGLGSEIKKTAASKRALLDKMKEDVGHLQARFDETIEAVRFVANSGDAIAILSVRKGMAHHTSTLLKLKCTVPNPSHKFTIQLQTESSMIQQVIPHIGRILVDGVANNSPLTANGTSGTPPQSSIPRPQYSTSAPPSNPYHPASTMSNGTGTSHIAPPPHILHGTAAGTRPMRQHNQPPPLHQINNMGNAAMPRPHAAGPMVPSSVHSKHPALYSQIHAPNPHRPTSYHQPMNVPPAVSRQGIGLPVTKGSFNATATTGIPSSSSQLLYIANRAPASAPAHPPHSPAPTSTAGNGWRPALPQVYHHPPTLTIAPTSALPSTSSAAAMLCQAAHAATADNQPSRPAIRLKLKLGGKDPLNVNGMDGLPSPEEPVLSTLKISSVMSLASEDSTDADAAAPADPVISNGLSTPPLERNHPVAKKRRKAPLSPYHISSQHAAGCSVSLVDLTGAPSLRPVIACPADGTLVPEIPTEDDPNEDYCAVCHNGGELICCDTCPKVYHANCHVPELTGAPSSFSCSLCWDEKLPPATPDTPGSGGSSTKRKAPSGLTDFEVKICEKILLRMFCHKRSLAFHLPVPKTVKHYSTYIKNPMDFISIRKKLMRQHFNHYDSVKDFIEDMRLVFSNCFAFNGPSSDYSESANQVQQYFVDHIAKYFPGQEELAASILKPEDVMNINLAKKRSGSANEDDPVVHIS